ncbi:hypothetical protein ACHAXR_003633 [Thalassiosira sp. AJA248-18]
MRHRLSPADSHHNENNNPNRVRPHGQSQQQSQVIQLERVIRLQNYVIVALSSLFVLVIMSTMVLVQHIPHPNDEHTPFWDIKRKMRFGQHDETHNLQQKQEKKTHLLANCTHYGCPLRPLEISQLNRTANTFIASTDHILLTHKSNRKKPAPVNQDRAVLIPSFGDDYKTLNPQSNFFLGVFDGHDDNGHHIAQFASEEIPSRIASKISLSMKTSDQIRYEIMKQIITQTFVDVDNDAPMPGGGCTATMMLRRGSTMYMANTGDSTSFIAVYAPPSHFDENKANSNKQYVLSPRSPEVQLHLQGTVTIHHINKKHKAHFSEEYSRIEALGGKVHIPPKNPMGSRVIVRSSTHSEDVGLAMSRSIGDWEWTAIGVIPDPDVVVLDLEKFWSENDIQNNGAKVFAVLGSDGLFDARKVEFVANHLAFGLFESRFLRESEEQDSDQQQTFDNHLIDLGKKLVNMASPVKEEWYRDDITFVAKVVEL